MKDGTSENNWTFELGVGDGIDIPTYILVGVYAKKSIQSTTPK